MCNPSPETQRSGNSWNSSFSAETDSPISLETGIPTKTRNIGSLIEQIHKKRDGKPDNGGKDRPGDKPGKGGGVVFSYLEPIAPVLFRNKFPPDTLRSKFSHA
jgi:hypothetical protein